MNRISEISLWAVAFSLVVLAWVFGLFIDLTGDSGLYAAISRQMVESGNWLDLKINGKPYDQKPHLLFWLAGLGIKLFGNSNFGFKIFPFLFGISSFYFIYRLGGLFFSKTAGKLAALIAGTSQIFFLYFLDIHTDTVLQVGVVLAIWQLAEYLNNNKSVHFVIGFFGIGLAMLAKGPVGAVLPFFFVLFFLIAKKDFNRLFHPKWILGIVLVLIVISPALIHLWKNFGYQGLRFYFFDNNIGRVSGEVAGSSTDPFYYLYNLLWAVLPWTVPVVVALWQEIKSWFGPQHVNKYSASLLGSVLVLLFIYSIAKGKAPNYMLILIPPVAVVAAGRIQNFRWPKNLIVVQLIVLIFMIFLLIGSVLLITKTKLMLLAFLFLTMIFSVSFFLMIDTEKLKKLVFSTVIVSAVFNLYLNSHIIPGLFQYQGARQALKIFEENSKPGDKLYNFAPEEYELFFMANDSIENIVIAKKLYDLLESDKTWVYTNEIKYNDVISNFEHEIDTVYIIKHLGMNELSLKFLNPKKRTESLNTNYLIKAN